MGQLSLFFFGSFRVALEDDKPIPFSTRSARALLIYLAMHAGQPVERDHLAALLWPDASKDQAQTSLRQTLYRLRQSLGQADAAGTYLIADATTVRFNAESDYHLDVAEFTGLLGQCRLHSHPRLEACDDCAMRMQRAVTLYKSGFLSGFALSNAPAFDEWQAFTQEQLHHQFIATLDTLAIYHQRRREYGAATRYLQQILGGEPWREESHIALMRCYLLDGKRHLALQQYQNLKRVLAAELNVQPSAEAQALYADLIQISASRKSAQTQIVNPYCGLNAFDQEQTAYFFGREEMAARLVEYIDQQPLLLLVGVSGSGKSSLLHAGVLPALTSPAQGGRRVAVMRPGEDPFAALAESLRPFLAHTSPPLAGDLRSGFSLYTLLDQIPFSAADASLVVLIDQFEEILVLPPQDETVQRFFDLLVETATADVARPRVSFLLALRADFLGHLLAHGRFASLIQDHLFALGAMSPEEMARAVEMPGQMQNVFFEPGLVDRLIEDVGEDPGRLPLLQFCLTRLWQKQKDGWITHAAYAEIEELSGALNHYADGILARLHPDQQSLARRVLLRLIHVQEDVEPSRRLGLRSEFSREEWAVVQTLTNARLLVTDRTGHGEESVELVHETLIRNWARLSEWIYADRAFAFWREGLRDGLRLWEKSGCDPGALLRGGLLAEAEARTADHWDELSPAERDFIAASLALHHREIEEEARQRERERERAEALAAALQSRIQALAEAQRATARAQSHAHVMAAQLALFQRDTDKALTLALAALDPDDPTPEAQLMLADAAYAPGTIRRCVGHRGSVFGVALYPDHRRAVSASADQSLMVWDLATGAEVRRLIGHTEAVHAVQVSPDGRRLLSAAADGMLILWDAESGAPIRCWQGHSGAVRAVCFHPNGKWALSGGADKRLILWDLESGDEIARFDGHGQPIYSLALSPDGGRILSGDAHGTVIHWDLASGRILHRLSGYLERGKESNPLISHYEAIWGIAFHKDGQTALSVSQDQTALLWDLSEGKLMRRYASFKSGLFAVAFHPNGHSALIGRMDGKLSILDLDSGRYQEFLGHAGRVFALVCCRDGRRALSGAADGTLRLWDLHHGAEIRKLDYRGGGYRLAASLDITSDETIGVVAAFTGEIMLVDMQSGAPIRMLLGHTEMALGGVKFLPDNRHLLSASGDIFAPIDDFSLRLWDVQSGAEIRRFLGHTDKIWDLALSPDGCFAVSASHDGTLRRWDLCTGEPIILADVYPQAVTAVAISPDGCRLLVGLGKGASNHPDYSLRILDSSGQEIHRLTGHPEAINDVAISPDGRLAISGSHDGRLMFWDMRLGSHVATLEALSDAPMRLVFSPDSKFVCQGAATGKALLWDIETRTLIRQFPGHAGNVVEVKFSGDGRRLYSASDEGTVHEWRVDPDLSTLRCWIERNRLAGELRSA